VADILDDRRKALEEDYFNRKNKEALDRLREARREEARARGEETATMQCPRCDGRLHEVTYEDVRIDRCDKCHGIWLDAGELEQIVSEEDAPGRWLRVFWPGRTGAPGSEK
jgi:Zn-finger nucleic acid-binding protein